MVTSDFQLEGHTGDDYPEWGSAPRKPLVQLDMAHRGEWMGSVIGPDVTTGQPMVYQILRCELCICLHAWPLPSPGALATYYQHHFYQIDKPEALDRMEADRMWWEVCVYGPLLEQCRWNVRLECPEETQIRYLDIGAGTGIGLDVAARKGWETSAIEPNATFAERLATRGHDTYCGTLETFVVEARRTGKQWHVLMAQEVLEHQPCGEAWLLDCYDLLGLGGLLVLVVPNDASPIQYAACERLGIAPYWWAVPQHLAFYTPKALQLLVRRCGFRIIDIRGTYPLDKHLLEGENYLGNDPVGRQVHGRRMVWELCMARQGRWSEVEHEYRENMRQRIGREIVVLAQRL